MRRSTSKSTVSNGFNREIDWELRPGGMLVQKRDIGDASSGHVIKIKVSHGSYHHDITVPAQSTFGSFLPLTLFLGFSYFLVSGSKMLGMYFISSYLAGSVSNVVKSHFALWGFSPWEEGI